MSQSYQPLVGTDTLTASRTVINNDLDALLTSFAGTAFPTINIAVGMTCYRTDLQKTYRLRSTGPATWVQSDNLNNSLNYSRFQYVSTAGQTTYTGADKNALTLTYTVGFVEINIDGVWLMPDDFTATDGTSVTINRAQFAGQNVYIQSLAPFNVVDVLTQSQNGADVLDKAKFRANIGVVKKNYILNGGMQISQENGSTAGTTSGYYSVDQFSSNFSNAGGWSSAQVASPTPGGSPNRLRITVTTADASVGAGDLAGVYQRIEGSRVADLKIGTSSAKTVTLQFGVRAPAGTYCVSFRNGLVTRSYIAEYTISAGEANTDVVKSVTVTLDQTGTWATDNGIGLDVWFGLMNGSTWSTAAGAWTAGNFIGSSNQFNFMGTLGNVFELFDVSLTEGSQAPPFQLPDFDDELRRCMRYFWKRAFVSGDSPPIANLQSYASGSAWGKLLDLPVEMRINGTVTVSSLSHLIPTNGAGSSQAAFTAIVFNSSTKTIGISSSSGSSGLTIGQVCILIFGTNGAWIAANSRM